MIRKRRYTLLHLKGYASLTRPISDIPMMFGRLQGNTFTWRDYLVAERNELAVEILWAAGRPSVNKTVWVTDDDAFLKCLNNEEENNRIGYKYVAPVGCTVSLMQRPREKPAFGTSKILHTITKKAHIC